MEDAVACAIAGQKPPNAHYMLYRMSKTVPRHGGYIACCGTCLDARGLIEEHLIDWAARSTIDEPTEWASQAGQIHAF